MPESYKIISLITPSNIETLNIGEVEEIYLSTALGKNIWMGYNNDIVYSKCINMPKWKNYYDELLKSEGELKLDE